MGGHGGLGWRATAAFLLGCLALSGCGQSAPGSPTSSQRGGAGPSAAPAGGPFMAVLEPGGFGQVDAAHNRVAIVRLDGRAVAKQFFNARAVPRIGNAAP